MGDRSDATRASLSHPVHVGREQELSVLCNALFQASDGRGSVVLISGEAGIGKTSLIQELISEAKGNGFLVLLGQCYDLSATPPYGPWIELVERYRPDDDSPPRPDFVDDLEAFDSLRSQEELFRASNDFLKELSEHSPLLVVLEDIHWADQASLDLLRYVARYVDRHRQMLVVSFRDDEVIRRHPLFRLLPSLIRESNATRIDLRPLGVRSIRRIAEQYSGLQFQEQRELVDYLLKWTEGNPLYVVEQLRTLEHEGVITPSDHGWKLRDLETATVPTLIRQIVQRRLSTLSEDAQRAVELAAIIGQHVPIDLWERLAGAETVEVAAEEALEHQLVVEDSSPHHVSFRHALVRAAIYESLSFLRRRHLHRSIAEAYLERASPDPETVAFHFQHAGDARAGEWLIKAGEQAERRHADREAFDRYDAALEVLQRGGGDGSQIAIVLLKAARTVLVFDPKRSNEYLYEARRTALESGEAAIAAQALISIGVNLCNLGQARQGLEDLRNGVAEIARATDATYRVVPMMSRRGAMEPLHWSNGVLALFLAAFGRYSESIETAERYMKEEWRSASDPDQVNELISRASHSVPGFEALGVSLAAMGQPDDSRLAFTLALQSIDPSNPYRLLTTSLQLLANHFPYRAADLAERERLASTIREAGDAASGFIDDYNLNWGYEHYLLHVGEWDELREIVASNPPPTLFDYWTASLTARARLAWYEGDLDEARRIIRTVLNDGPSTEPDDLVHFAVPGAIHRIAAGVELDAGNLSLAREWLDAHERWMAFSSATLGNSEGVLLRGMIYKAEGDIEHALECANRALNMASDPFQPISLIAAHRFLGQSGIEREGPPDAQFHLDRSRELAEACAIPFEQAQTLEALAELEIKQGNDLQVRRYVREARQIFERLGAQPALERLRQLSVRTGPDRQDETTHSGLSRREIEVLRLLARGMTDKEIASELFISPHTVMRHVSHILAKLDVDSRTAAAAYAVRQGIG